MKAPAFTLYTIHQPAAPSPLVLLVRLAQLPTSGRQPKIEHKFENKYKNNITTRREDKSAHVTYSVREYDAKEKT